jgi:hypothetical protein
LQSRKNLSNDISLQIWFDDLYKKIKKNSFREKTFQIFTENLMRTVPVTTNVIWPDYTAHPVKVSLLQKIFPIKVLLYIFLKFFYDFLIT